MYNRRFSFTSLITALGFWLIAATTVSAQHFDTRESFAEVNGISIHYQMTGNGPPLLLLHGYTGSGRWWIPYLDNLAEHYTVILPDLPGHGRSEGRNGPYRFDVVAGDLFELMNTLDINRFRAIGYSGGGIALFHMATVDPDRMESIVVVSAPHQLYKTDILAFPDYENHPPQVLAYWQENHPGGEAQVRKLIERFHGVANITEEMSLTCEQLSTIKARTLIVSGDRDGLVPLPMVLQMTEAIPDASLWVIPSQGHSPIWPDWGGSEYAAQVFPDVATLHLGTEATDK